MRCWAEPATCFGQALHPNGAIRVFWLWNPLNSCKKDQACRLLLTRDIFFCLEVGFPNYSVMPCLWVFLWSENCGHIFDHFLQPLRKSELWVFKPDRCTAKPLQREGVMETPCGGYSFCGLLLAFSASVTEVSSTKRPFGSTAQSMVTETGGWSGLYSAMQNHWLNSVCFQKPPQAEPLFKNTHWMLSVWQTSWTGSLANLLLHVRVVSTSVLTMDLWWAS